MKNLFILAALFSILILSATMTEPAEFWPNPIKMSEQNSITKLDDTSYLVFADKNTSEIIFAKAEDLNEIEFQVIDLSNNWFYNPTLVVVDANHIFLAYSRYTANFELETVLAESTDGGETFQLEVQEFAVLNPVIVHQNGDLKIAGLSGSDRDTSEYGFFTDKDLSVNADDGSEAAFMKFWGRDVLRGDIHSNTDIWIQNGGGGDNNGWPTFHGFVSTAGRILSYPGGGPLPVDDIFLGGYAENIPPKSLPEDLSELEESGIHLGGDADILYIELDGDNYTGYEGVLTPQVVEFPVYSWYPADAEQVQYAIDAGINWFEESDLIYTNYVTIYDTVWTEISGEIADGASYYTDADLWIKGIVSGKQVWGSSGSVRILGDISYLNTELGEFPDGFTGYSEDNEPEYNGVLNQTDYFGLVSKDVMNVAYKYRHPATGEVISVSSGEQDEIYLYGAYAAVAKGEEELYGSLACHYDGIFSFEYQHSHGSTPSFIAPSPYTGNDTLYTFVDLHKFIYPIDLMVTPDLVGFNIHGNARFLGTSNTNANGYPNVSAEYLNSCPNNSPDYVYPLGTDYPWYNPVWPESVNDIVFERGVLKIIGSLTQRRRGYTHRSGTDPYNHPSGTNEWNMEQFHFGGDHSSTGYDKDYYYDNRLEETELPGFPKLKNDFKNPDFVVWESDDMGSSFNPLYQNEVVQDINYGADFCEILAQDNYLVIKLGTFENSVYWISADEGESFSEHSFEVINENPHLHNGVMYLEVEGTVKGYSLPEMELVFQDSEYSEGAFDLTTLGDNIALVDYEYNTDLVSYRFTVDGGNSFAGEIEQAYPIFNQNIYEIAMFGLDEEEFFTIFNFDNSGCMYQYGTLDGITEYEPEQIPELKPTLANYPNPFNPTTEIWFTAKVAEEAKIEIYNIKGQRIREFKMENVKCKMNKISWNGTDQNKHPVASGIYYYTLKLDGKITASRKMVLLK